MWEELVKVGLDPKEAKLFQAVLERGRPTVAEAAEAAGISRTNAYDLTKRLTKRGLLTTVEIGPSGEPGGRGRSLLVATDPERLLDDWHERKQILDNLVPQLRAMHKSGGARPRVRYLEGVAGIRTALFETLNWPSPVRGILSMRDLLTAPGREAMEEYIEQRRRRALWLRVVRSPEHDLDNGWPSSTANYRESRYAPANYMFTMTTIVGDDVVAVLSSRAEDFAMMIESHEYAEMQANLFEVLWETCREAPRSY